MSAIAGIVNLDGAPVDTDLLTRMQLAGVRRGPAARGQWVNKTVGFAFCGVEPFKEMAIDQQPFYDSKSDLVVMVDGHIHGRDELRALCEAAGHSVRTCEEAELVLRAYEAWGELAPEYILGEYAFTVWDPSHHRFVCARDGFGTRPFFYVYTANKTFQFATGANQLLVNPALRRSPDIEGIVQLLAGCGTLDPHRTPCSSIQRLPAAHTLVVDERGIQVRPYWSLREEVNGELLPRKHYVAACAEALQVAIRDRLTDSDRIGISLSGGWDSGAIFTLWQWMRSQGEPLPPAWTHTHYCDYPEADEREPVRALVQRWPAEGSVMHVTADSLLTGVEEHVLQLGMPETAFGWRYLRQQGAELRSAGIRNVLTGEGGNYVVQSSLLKACDFLKKRQFRDSVSQLKFWAKELHRPIRQFLWPYFVKPSLPVLCPRLWHTVRTAGHALSCIPSSLPYLTIQAQETLSDLTKHCHRPQPGISLASWDHCTRLEQLQQSLFPLAAASDLEAIQVRAPYLDRRVVRVALAGLEQETLPAPSRDLLGKVLDRTAGHRLPDSYGHVSRYVNDALRADLKTGNTLFAASILSDLGIVDRQGVQDLSTGYASGREQNQFPLWRLVSVEAWARCWLVQNNPKATI